MNESVSAKKNFEVIGFFLGWISVVAQFILIIQNRQADITETIIRFFSFFTILTNILVAIYFTATIFKKVGKKSTLFQNKGTLTAITTFILVVGLVYQFVLRGIWEPKGAQFIVDELLHTVNPLYFLLYWFIFCRQEKIQTRDVILWLLYPFFYLVFVLCRGLLSDFFPYPFLNISEIGVGQVLINCVFIVALLFGVLRTLLFINNKNTVTNKI